MDFTLVVMVFCFFLVFMFVYFFLIPTKKNQCKVVEDIIIFEGGKKECRHHLYTSEYCPLVNCARKDYNRMLNYINNAEESLNICMNMITCFSIIEAIISCFHRGVKVRVITDAKFSFNTTSKITELRRAKIPVRMNNINSEVTVHTKYVIIDRKILISGSLNWTASAFSLNYEHVVITSSEILVRKTFESFEVAWNRFSPENYKNY